MHPWKKRDYGRTVFSRHFFPPFFATLDLDLETGLPDGIFSNQKSQYGKFWRVLRWKMLAYFMAIWYTLWLFGIFFPLLVYFVAIWYILYSFGTVFPVLVSCTEKDLATLLGNGLRKRFSIRIKIFVRKYFRLSSSDGCKRKRKKAKKVLSKK
jgi:hypothetical protein